MSEESAAPSIQKKETINSKEISALKWQIIYTVSHTAWEYTRHVIAIKKLNTVSVL